MPNAFVRVSVFQSLYRQTISLLFIVLLLSAGYKSYADIKITFDAKEGDKVSDVYVLVAHVESTDNIDKVEFQVDNQVRFTGVSLPYQFKWDTLADTEGKHTITVTAYDANGKTKKETLSLMVDNELSLGGDALAQKSQQALAAKDLQAARLYSRRALKVDPDNIGAARVLAGLYASEGEYGKAIALLDKAKNLDSSTEALQDLATYRMSLAIVPENAAKFTGEIKSIVALRHKADDRIVELVKKRNTADSPASHEAIGDALVNAGRYDEAIEEYSKSAIKDDAPLTSINRLALAYIMNHDFDKALTLIKTLQIAKQDDAVSRAIMGLILLRQHKPADALGVVNRDIQSSTPATLVIASYANTQLEKRKQAASEATEAVGMVPHSADAYYAQSMSLSNPLEAEKALTTAITEAPFLPGLYLDYAVRQALTRQKPNYRYDAELELLDFVLLLEPQSIDARLVQALIYLQTKRAPEAKTILVDVFKKYPNEPDVLFVMATYSRQLNNNDFTSRYMDALRKLDPAHYSIEAPTVPFAALQLLDRNIRYRTEFFLSPATLYPAKASASAVH